VGRSRTLALVAAVSLFVANPPPAAAVTNGPTTAHSSYLSAISCPTATVCVAVGAVETDIDSASGRLIGGSFQAMAVRTTDAGKSWVPVELPVLDASLSAVSCWSAAQCVAVGATHVASHGSWWAASAVVVRIDGGTGSRAAAIPSGAKALDAVSCPSATTCIAAGGAFIPGTVALHPDVLVSHDGGASWAGAVLPIAQGLLQSVSCSSTSHCVALGASPYKRANVDFSKPVGLLSSDGGLSWKVATVPGGSGGPTAVACQSASHCLAVGDKFNWCLCGTGTPGHYASSWVTDDGGATWSEQVLPTLGGYDVWYANALSCWATACAMAGTATTTKFQSAYYAIFQSLSASGGPSGPPSTSASGLRRQYIYGLSCQTASNCVAVGQDWSKEARVISRDGRSQSQGCLAEEGFAKLGVAADAAQAVVGFVLEFFDRVGAVVGQFVALEVAPHSFYGVELVGVAGEALDSQPGGLGAGPGGHLLGAMGGQAVPDQGDVAAVEQVVGGGEELDQRVVVVGAGAHPED